MKVSIITATFNSESTIEDAVKSVISQTYNNIEYIIIDGNSSDKTLSLIKNYQSKISKIISEPDKGIYDALNKGIKNASGDLIAFLHGDDIYANDRVIENAVSILKKENTDSIYADLLYISKHNENKVLRNWKAGIFKPSKLKLGWMPPHPTFLIKKSIYDSYGLYDTNLRISADYDIILRFLGTYKISVSYLQEIMIKMRIGGESNKSFKNILKKMNEDVKVLKRNKMGNWYTVLLKNIIKIPQLFIK